MMKNLSLDPFPTLETARLNLRELTPDDAGPMYRLRSSREVMRLIDRPLCQSLEDAQQLVGTILEKQSLGEAIMWAISLGDDPAMIGCIGYFRTQTEHGRTEVGYLLDPNYHRLGYMSEALNCVVEFGFARMEFHKITASVHANNDASILLLEKNGFVREALFRQHYFWNGHFIDTVEMASYSPAAVLAMKASGIQPVDDVHRTPGQR